MTKEFYIVLLEVRKQVSLDVHLGALCEPVWTSNWKLSLDGAPGAET
jgi:hypothetical protein